MFVQNHFGDDVGWYCGRLDNKYQRAFTREPFLIKTKRQFFLVEGFLGVVTVLAFIAARLFGPPMLCSITYIAGVCMMAGLCYSLIWEEEFLMRRRRSKIRQSEHFINLDNATWKALSSAHLRPGVAERHSSEVDAFLLNADVKHLQELLGSKDPRPTEPQRLKLVNKLHELARVCVDEINALDEPYQQLQREKRSAIAHQEALDAQQSKLEAEAKRDVFDWQVEQALGHNEP